MRVRQSFYLLFKIVFTLMRPREWQHTTSLALIRQPAFTPDVVEEVLGCDARIHLNQSRLRPRLTTMVGHRRDERTALFYGFSLEKHKADSDAGLESGIRAAPRSRLRRQANGSIHFVLPLGAFTSIGQNPNTSGINQKAISAPAADIICPLSGSSFGRTPSQCLLTRR